MTIPQLTPFASVIIPTFRGALTLSAAVERVLQSRYPAFEIIVVDNGADKETKAAIAGLPPSVKLIQAEKNLGFAGGNNLGVQYAQGEILVFLNDDTEVRPDWLGNLISALLSLPHAGLVGSLILEPDGKQIQHAGSRFNANCLNSHIGKGEIVEKAPAEPVELEYVMGAAIALRRETFLQVGGLAECYFPGYFEDSELCRRLRDWGYRIYLVPSAVLIHKEKQTLQDERHYFRAYHRNRWLFILRNLSGMEILRAVAAELVWVVNITRWRDFRHHAALIHAYCQAIMKLPWILGQRRAWRRKIQARST